MSARWAAGRRAHSSCSKSRRQGGARTRAARRVGGRAARALELFEEVVVRLLGRHFGMGGRLSAYSYSAHYSLSVGKP